MNKNERRIIILELFRIKETIKVSDILKRIQVDRTTIFRDLRELLSKGTIEEVGKGIYRRKVSFREYFDTPFFDRPKIGYNFDFLGSYEPNVSSFLGEKYDIIRREYLDTQILSSYDYKVNIRAIENLLIDLSFSSSKLEGNTYSYLDTEILIKYNNTPEWKTPEETQMILNHKSAIKYIIDNKNEIRLSKIDFQNIHILLGKWLLAEGYLWNIRSSEVNIGGSAYIPLDNHHQLSGEFDHFLEKLNAIKNPFEQSLFILVFIPYFQIFMDINKRTSRIWANIPLIKNGLTPFSFLQIQDRDYIDAILAIYELNDTSLMRDIFVTNYLLNRKRYT